MLKRFIGVLLILIFVLTGCNNDINNDVNIGTNNNVNKDIDLSKYNVNLDESNRITFTDDELSEIDDVIDELVKNNPELKNFTYVSGKGIDNIKEEDYALIFVYKYCGPCKVYKGELFNYINREDSFPIYLVDVENIENKRYIEKYSIQATPTTLIFKNNQLQVFEEGNLDISTLESLIGDW